MAGTAYPGLIYAGEYFPQATGGPFTQTPVFDNPPAPVRRVMESTFAVNLLVTVLATTQAPFSQKDWPNPPQSARRPIVQMTGQMPVATTVFRSPTFAPRAVPRPPFVDIPPNLLTTTLTPSQAAPFSQTYFPNPARKILGQADQPPNLLLSTLAKPFSQTDWPVPPSRRSSEIPQQPGSLATTQPVPVGKIPDFPNPLRRSAIPTDAPQDLLTTTLAVTAGTPFAQADWPNPQSRKPIVQVEPVPNLQTTTFVVVGAAPFKQSDWQNPRIRPPVFQTDIPQDLLTTTLGPLAPVQPPGISRWPNPQPRLPIVQIAGPPNLLVAELAVPFVPIPNPYRPHRADEGCIDRPKVDESKTSTRLKADEGCTDRPRTDETKSATRLKPDEGCTDRSRPDEAR